MVQADIPRLIDVARASGVSIATASRAMSGTPGVSEELALQVRAVAERLGYVPNSHARGLAGGLVASIGLVVHEIRDPYFADIASGVVHRANERGLAVQITHADRSPNSELGRVRDLVLQRVGAIIIAGSGYTDRSLEASLDDELARYRARGGRIAVIGRHHLDVDMILPDNLGAGASLGAHLVALGHRRIGIAAGPLELNTVRDRLEGLRQAFDPAGAELFVEQAEFTREGGLVATSALLDSSRDISAIVGLNDAMALGVLRALRDRSILVPEQISVAGFDDITVAADVAPALTTVRIPMYEMGLQAVELTVDRVVAPRRVLHLGHELVIRQSTAPPTH